MENRQEKVLRPKHIIWDWNGTLVDDAWLCVQILNRVLREAGLAPVTLDAYRGEDHFPVEEYYRRLGFDFARRPYADLSADYNVEYARRRFECRLQEGAEELLARCRAAGLGQSVLSAYEQHSLEEMIGGYGLSRFFDRIVGRPDFDASGKTELGRRLLDELDLAPEAVLLVGDTSHDHAVASVLAIPCVLFYGGHQSPAVLAHLGPPVIDRLADLEAMLG